MDFYHIKERLGKNGVIEIFPDFIVVRSKDLMIRGKSFYAIWDEARGLWSTDEYDVQRLVDEELEAYAENLKATSDSTIKIKYMRQFSSKSWPEFRTYLNHLSDNAHQLDSHLTFANTEVKKKDYVSRRLPYSLEEGSCDAYEEIISTLYDPEERAKIEWAIGAVISGDSQDIQKFMVLYGKAGTGKSTILNVIQKLFDGYYTAFEAKALTSSSNGFSTEVFRANPLVAIDHDGDLSRIEDNTKLNSIVSHEMMTMNEKYKPSYMARANAFLFMGTNKPVKITDAKSGIIRRLIDVRPSGRTIPVKRYMELIGRIDFELGAIAHKCLEVYRKMGKNYYNAYRPLDMILQTDVFFNFVESNFLTFKEQDGVSLSQAYEMYKTFCTESLIETKMPRHKFREELKNYFRDFCDITRVDGKQVRSYYGGFLAEKFSIDIPLPKPEEPPSWIVLDQTVSLLDEDLKDCPAQYASDEGIPEKKWERVRTTLRDITASKLHYVKPPENRIVIDIDLKDENGNKDPIRSLEAASKFPPTYAEFSKSQAGIHLHYNYDGDTSKLAPLYSPGIEIKVFHGGSALRRMLTRCNNIPVTTINSGLPLKEEKKVINAEAVKSEKALRELIRRNLRKEIHPGTRPSIDFIFKILEDAYNSGLKYDVTTMRPQIMAFANNSTHWADYCLRVVAKMHFQSEDPSENVERYRSDTLVFFDVEVFKNLFIVCWKYQGKDSKCVTMINPTAKDIEPLFQEKLVGFNNRRYDNHILYARYLGMSNEELYDISQKIINESRNAMFGEAYNLSFTDIFDFASKKQSLKKWQIELGIHHQELGIPWDQPIPEDKWALAGEYCCNDVISEEVVFEHLRADYVARQILSDLSGLTMNDTTQMHTARIIFGDDKKPQDKFVYTDLRDLFPGYVFKDGKSTYRGEEVGEGGYVYAEPGAYSDVALLDIASMHPTSAECLNLFGPYTARYSELKAARIAIKHRDFDRARTMLDGKLAPYLVDGGDIEGLAYSLKIAINIVYGLTSASFPNKFRDPRNVDNIVAKRGALFMIDLKHAVQEEGFKVAHIKTDSIKIPNATPAIIDFVMEFGKRYGYIFEHEATYSRLGLVNDAVYIARYDSKDKKHPNQWTATGAQFAHPIVFKTLFSGEPVVFGDYCEAKTVTSALYLDMNENLPDGEHNMHFVGKAGLFVPILPGHGGGLLLREKDGKFSAATGSKGYRWLEAEVVKALGSEDVIDTRYSENLVKEAREDISKLCDFNWFVADPQPVLS